MWRHYAGRDRTMGGPPRAPPFDAAASRRPLLMGQCADVCARAAHACLWTGLIGIPVYGARPSRVWSWSSLPGHVSTPSKASATVPPMPWLLHAWLMQRNGSSVAAEENFIAWCVAWGDPSRARHDLSVRLSGPRSVKLSMGSTRGEARSSCALLETWKWVTQCVARH